MVGVLHPNSPERPAAGEIERLIRRAQAGDLPARDALIERFYPEVSRMVRRQLDLQVRNSKQALAALFSTGDVVHEVLMGVMRDLRRFRAGDERAFVSYLATTVTTQLMDTIRFHRAKCRDRGRDRAGTVLARAELSSDMTSPTRAVRNREFDAAVDEVVALLPQRLRDVFRLRFRQERPYAEIARTLGMSSAEAARKAARTAHARVLVGLRRRGFEA